MKLQRFVGADAQVGSLVRRDNGSVDMRSAVIRHMKKPMEERITRPMREPTDMFKPKITGIGRMNITRSVRRFRIAFDQLKKVLVNAWCLSFVTYRWQKKLMHVPGMARLYTRGTGVH
jgi:hypothetical protein